jgi:hypothetical protein
MKRYVCEVCHGAGSVTTITDEPQDGPRAEPDYWFKSDQCPSCVTKGYTPFVIARTPDDEAIVEAVKPVETKIEVTNANPEEMVSGSGSV